MNVRTLPLVTVKVKFHKCFYEKILRGRYFDSFSMLKMTCWISECSCHCNKKFISVRTKNTVTLNENFWGDQQLFSLNSALFQYNVNNILYAIWNRAHLHSDLHMELSLCVSGYFCSVLQIFLYWIFLFCILFCISVLYLLCITMGEDMNLGSRLRKIKQTFILRLLKHNVSILRLNQDFKCLMRGEWFK